MDTQASSQTGIESVHRSPISEQVIDEVVVNSKPVNRQLFENSPLADHPVTQAAHNDPDRLFSTNGNEPTFAVLNEKPEHRLIVYLKAQGLSNKEVADRTGHTYSWICQLTRQPWFRLRLVQELKDAGVDAVMSTIKAAALDSVFTIIDLRDDVTAPKAVRRACADSLLDRFLGKPTQKIETDEKRLPSTPEISAIDQQLAEIDKQLEPQQ